MSVQLGGHCCIGLVKILAATSSLNVGNSAPDFTVVHRSYSRFDIAASRELTCPPSGLKHTCVRGTTGTGALRNGRIRFP
jgi:hypothetical protein